MSKLEELNKKFSNLNINRLKICGYLADYEIDSAIDGNDFNFIANLLINYFDEKDIGYLLTKFEESGLKDKVDDVDFSLEEWYKVQEELEEEEKNFKENIPDIHIKDKDKYLKEMIKKRKSK